MLPTLYANGTKPSPTVLTHLDLSCLTLKDISEILIEVKKDKNLFPHLSSIDSYISNFKQAKLLHKFTAGIPGIITLVIRNLAGINQKILEDYDDNNVNDRKNISLFNNFVKNINWNGCKDRYVCFNRFRKDNFYSYYPILLIGLMKIKIKKEEKVPMFYSQFKKLDTITKLLTMMAFSYSECKEDKSTIFINLPSFVIDEFKDKFLNFQVEMHSLVMHYLNMCNISSDKSIIFEILILLRFYSMFSCLNKYNSSDLLHNIFPFINEYISEIYELNVPIEFKDPPEIIKCKNFQKITESCKKNNSFLGFNTNALSPKNFVDALEMDDYIIYYPFEKSKGTDLLIKIPITNCEKIKYIILGLQPKLLSDSSRFGPNDLDTEIDKVYQMLKGKKKMFIFFQIFYVTQYSTSICNKFKPNHDGMVGNIEDFQLRVGEYIRAGQVNEKLYYKKKKYLEAILLRPDYINRLIGNTPLNLDNKENRMDIIMNLCSLMKNCSDL